MQDIIDAFHGDWTPDRKVQVHRENGSILIGFVKFEPVKKTVARVAKHGAGYKVTVFGGPDDQPISTEELEYGTSQEVIDRVRQAIRDRMAE